MEDDPDIVDRMIDYLYRLDYDDQPDSATAKDTNGRLVVNSLVYAIADKYEILSLKDAAKKKTAELVEKEWNEDSFLTALAIVWTTTPQCDRGLRDLFVPVICEHKKELIAKKICVETVRNVGDLAVDVVQGICTEPERVSVDSYEVEFWCDNYRCRRNKTVDVRCPSCNDAAYIRQKH